MISLIPSGAERVGAGPVRDMDIKKGCLKRKHSKNSHNIAFMIIMQKHQNGKQRNASRTKHKAKANHLKG